MLQLSEYIYYESNGRMATLNPRSFNVRANCELTVDFPTPPLPDNTKITCFTSDNIFHRELTAVTLTVSNLFRFYQHRVDEKMLINLLPDVCSNVTFIILIKSFMYTSKPLFSDFELESNRNRKPLNVFYRNENCKRTGKNWFISVQKNIRIFKYFLKVLIIC